MTDDLAPYTDLERALTRLIRRAFLPTAGEVTRREAGVALERAAYTTLVRIAELEAGRLSELAEVLGLDASTTSRHVKGLVDAGYVEVAPDPDDARARRYSPTAAGRDALERVRDIRRTHLARVLHDWEPDEVTTLALGLDRIVSAFEDDERRRG